MRLLNVTIVANGDRLHLVRPRGHLVLIVHRSDLLQWLGGRLLMGLACARARPIGWGSTAATTTHDLDTVLAHLYLGFFAFKELVQLIVVSQLSEVCSTLR